MKFRTILTVALAQAARVHAHGHQHGERVEGETVQQYAQRHMSSEHHIDGFDIDSFFHLHDLNRDGYWDPEEVEAIYGVHHIYSQKKSKDDEAHKKKADFIHDTVMGLVDTNKDGLISLAEFIAVGLDGLPNFDDLGAEGHHYDIESEFFLHHEEEFHSTPETQTDESYNHPEDLEHFGHHEAIERKEAEKEAIFEGLTVQEVLEAQHKAAEEAALRVAEHEHRELTGQPPLDVEHKDPVADHPHVEAVGHDGLPEEPPVQAHEPKPKITRTTPPEKQDPVVKFQEATKNGVPKADWGTGEDGYKTPKSPIDKARKNLPYKDRMQYKFRRNWGDF